MIDALRKAPVQAALLCMLPFAAQANLIANGSFEDPVVPAGTYELFNTGGTFSGWTVVGANGNVGLTSGSFTQSGFSFPAEDGAQWLDLTGTSNTATGVQQTVTTAPGQKYDLSFWVGNVSGNIFGTTSTVDVILNGTQVLAATNSNVSDQTLLWQEFTYSFTATSSSTTLAFINADPPSDNSNGLDNVVLTAVPEPTSLVLVGIGLLGLDAMRRRGGLNRDR